MRIEFRTLFSMSIAHSFYQGSCDDLRFLVPPETGRRLKGGRLLAREVDGSLVILFEVDEDGEPMVPLAGTTLRFGLRLLNPYFGNFTQLPAGFPIRKLYHSNAADPALLAAREGPVVVGPRFAHAPPGAARPVAVTLRGADGDVVETAVLDTGAASLSFDLRNRPSGFLSLEEVYPTETITVPILLDAELHQMDAVGVVEVEIDDAFYTTPPELEVRFVAREEVLRYYLVARNYSASEFNQLRVSDAGFEEEQRPEVTFQRVLPAAFTAAEMAPSLISGTGDRVALFRSRSALARRERGRRRIQLSKNNDLLISSLPQPGADRSTAELIIHVSKP